MFLQALGIIFLIVLCVIGYFVWKFFRFVKKHTDSDFSKAMSILPDQDMELEPSSRDEWVEKDQLDHKESELKKIGSTHLGYYCIYSGQAIIRLSMWNFKNQATALIYEAGNEQTQKNVSFIFEVVCKLKSGSLCITSNANAIYGSRPSNHKLIFNESNSLLDFLKALKGELPAGEKPLKIRDPKDFFMESYEDVAEWGWRAEQLNSDKTKQTLSSIGVEVTDELMEELIEIGSNYSIELNVKRAKRKLAQHSKMTVEQWEKIRDKIVFINEKMGVDHIIDAIYEMTDELTDLQEQVIDGFQNTNETLTDPISAFQLLLQTLNIKSKRISTMETPIRTEVYLPL